MYISLQISLGRFGVNSTSVLATQLIFVASSNAYHLSVHQRSY